MIKQGKAFEVLKAEIENRVAKGEKYIHLHELTKLMGDISHREFTKIYSGKDVADELSSFVNSIHHDSREWFIDGVLTDHRQLQSDTFNLFYKCFEGWARAYKLGNYDARNEGACKLSEVMVKAVDDM